MKRRVPQLSKKAEEPQRPFLTFRTLTLFKAGTGDFPVDQISFFTKDGVNYEERDMVGVKHPDTAVTELNEVEWLAKAKADGFRTLTELGIYPSQSQYYVDHYKYTRILGSNKKDVLVIDDFYHIIEKVIHYKYHPTLPDWGVRVDGTPIPDEPPSNPLGVEIGSVKSFL